jgi:hypothetical protein
MTGTDDKGAEVETEIPFMKGYTVFRRPFRPDFFRRVFCTLERLNDADCLPSSAPVPNTYRGYLITSPNAPVDEIVLPMRTYIPPDQVGDMRLCRKVIQINSNLVALWAGDYNQAYHFAERAMKWFSGDANSKDHLLGFLDAY